jgi:hypothetical protein
MLENVLTGLNSIKSTVRATRRRERVDAVRRTPLLPRWAGRQLGSASFSSFLLFVLFLKGRTHFTPSFIVPTREQCRCATQDSYRGFSQHTCIVFALYETYINL